VTGARLAAFRLAALVVAAAVGGLALALSGIPPIAAGRAMLDAALLGGPWAALDTLTQATPLVLTGLACTLSFRAGLWNVGAEGQLLLGAWAATGLASFWLPPGLPAEVVLPALCLGGMVAGAAWGAVPGALRALAGTSEILVSLMLVYVAVQFNAYFVNAPWSEAGFQMTPRFPDAACLPGLDAVLGGWIDLRGGQAHVGLFVALLLAAATWVVLERTRLGYELTVLGASRDTAAYAGIPVRRLTIGVMAASGALAGLAGAIEVSGVVHRLQENFTGGAGFTGILIAWIARLHAGGVVLAAVLFGGLLVGAREVQPAGVGTLLQGVVLLVLIAAEAGLRYRIERVEVTR